MDTQYKIGSTGTVVSKIQTRLKELGYYTKLIDGDFGKNTQTAVGSFQQSCNLKETGIVDSVVWKLLFPADNINLKCLALTGSFETSNLSPECFAAIAGNFDGQGISFGALQWNFGQGTLQPLIKTMFDKYPSITNKIFGTNAIKLLSAMSSVSASLAFANTIQNSKHQIDATWKALFKQLGLTPEFQEIESQAALTYHNKGTALFDEYGLTSERGRALMFDIAVQNGSIKEAIKQLILSDFNKLDKKSTRENLEVAKMRIIANRRAEAANAKYIEDVRKRKLCIAEGKGVVHGMTYNLKEQFNITLDVI